MKILTEQELNYFLIDYPEWQCVEGKFVGKYEFANFFDVSVFITKCIDIMNGIDHHPDVTFGYDTVEIVTCTHDVGGMVTDRDIAFVKILESNRPLV